jgi:hypothetical protein
MAKLFQGKNQHPAHNNERVLIKRKRKIVHNERNFLEYKQVKGPPKHKYISDLTKKQNLNFIALSETGRSEFMPRFLKNLHAGRDYLCIPWLLRADLEGCY